MNCKLNLIDSCDMNQIVAVQFSVIVNVNRLRCRLMLTVPAFFFPGRRQTWDPPARKKSVASLFSYFFLNIFDQLMTKNFKECSF